MTEPKTWDFYKGDEFVGSGYERPYQPSITQRAAALGVIPTKEAVEAAEAGETPPPPVVPEQPIEPPTEPPTEPPRIEVSPSFATTHTVASGTLLTINVRDIFVSVPPGHSIEVAIDPTQPETSIHWIYSAGVLSVNVGEGTGTLDITGRVISDRSITRDITLTFIGE